MKAVHKLFIQKAQQQSTSVEQVSVHVDKCRVNVTNNQLVQ